MIILLPYPHKPGYPYSRGSQNLLSVFPLITPFNITDVHTPYFCVWYCRLNAYTVATVTHTGKCWSYVLEKYQEHKSVNFGLSTGKLYLSGVSLHK